MSQKYNECNKLLTFLIAEELELEVEFDSIHICNAPLLNHLIYASNNILIELFFEHKILTIKFKWVVVYFIGH